MMMPINLIRKTPLAALAATLLLGSSFSLSSHAQENATPAAATVVEAPAAPVVEEAPPTIDTGDNAWMLVSTALVIFMSFPGLALFYGGIVRKKNILSVFAQIFAIGGVTAIIWYLIGFSLVFTDGGSLNDFIGGTEAAFFNGVGADPGVLPTVSQSIFATFQLTFAIITPALIIGAIAERMKFAAVLLFSILWLFLVYFPFAHMVWGGGALANGKIAAALDFAGGTVVHMSSGYSALVLAMFLGKRKGYGKEPLSPASIVLTAVGASILWVGWYGFNAGSAGAADGIAGNAFATTTFAAAIGGLSWALAEWVFKSKPSVLGFSSGVIGGLVAITPAAGFVSVGAAIIFGFVGGFGTFIASVYLKKALGYDDALDTFGVHGVGGTLGAIMTGIYASSSINPAVPESGLLLEQFKAVAFTAVWSVIATVIIVFIVKATVGLRVSEEVEETGLDITEHGEQGFEI